nr:hypothetical protein GCM10025699_73840 [Microbacterium flavescens]
MQFDGGGSVEPVTDGRYTFLIDKTHLGKTATLTSFAGGIEGESIDVALTLDEDAAPGIIPVMPRVLGVSKDSQGCSSSRARSRTTLCSSTSSR